MNNKLEIGRYSSLRKDTWGPDRRGPGAKRLIRWSGSWQDFSIIGECKR